MRAMRRSRPIAFGLLAAAAAAGVAGCGQGSPPGALAARGLPLVAGTRVIVQARRCDGGAHPYCARQLVIVGRPGRYPSSGALMRAEGARLRRAGWSGSEGDTIHEAAAESPGHRLRVTYAEGSEDLLSIEQARIERAPAVARALSRELFARAPVLSIMLQAGSA